ncbi:hypothetical protein EJB05_52816, partial [Eragrostis curvula]
MGLRFRVLMIGEGEGRYGNDRVSTAEDDHAKQMEHNFDVTSAYSAVRPCLATVASAEAYSDKNTILHCSYSEKARNKLEKPAQPAPPILYLPERPDDLERVEAAGGRVINWNGYRVLGVLATSRSIGFTVTTDPVAQALFDTSISVILGDGKSALLWRDRWMDGQPLATITPNLVAAVPMRIRNSRLVADALRVLAIASQVVLATTPDQFRWKWTPDGRFTSASAYHAFSIGQSEVLGARVLLKTQAPNNCRFFFWLTLNRQLRHKLKNDDTCAFCAQEPETLDHLLLHCVHSRETWFRVLRRLALNHLAPSVDEPPFVEWWLRSRKRVPKELRPGFNTLTVLVAWRLWGERNKRVHEF